MRQCPPDTRGCDHGTQKAVHVRHIARSLPPRRRVLVAACAVLGLTLAACGGDDGNKLSSGSSTSPSAGGKGSVVVVSAGFTEIQLLSEMYSALLKKAGYSPSIKVVQNREVYEPALEKGQADVVPDYAATMTEFLNHKVNGPNAATVATNDAQATVAALNDIAKPRGLFALEPSMALDSNAFAVTKDFAAKHNLKTLSDLGASGMSVRLAATPECPQRPFCQIGLEKTYGIKISRLDPLGFDTIQVKQAVKSGKDDLGLVATTDATLGDFNLVVLEDDKRLQLADNLVPVVGKKFAADQTFADALNQLSAVLTTDDLAELNKQVDQERQKASDVAQKFLQSKGLA